MSAADLNQFAYYCVIGKLTTSKSIDVTSLNRLLHRIKITILQHSNKSLVLSQSAALLILRGILSLFALNDRSINEIITSFLLDLIYNENTSMHIRTSLLHVFSESYSYNLCEMYPVVIVKLVDTAITCNENSRSRDDRKDLIVLQTLLTLIVAGTKYPNGVIYMLYTPFTHLSQCSISMGDTVEYTNADLDDIISSSRQIGKQTNNATVHTSHSSAYISCFTDIINHYLVNGSDTVRCICFQIIAVLTYTCHGHLGVKGARILYKQRREIIDKAATTSNQSTMALNEELYNFNSALLWDILTLYPDDFSFLLYDTKNCIGLLHDIIQCTSKTRKAVGVASCMTLIKTMSVNKVGNGEYILS